MRAHKSQMGNDYLAPFDFSLNKYETGTTISIHLFPYINNLIGKSKPMSMPTRKQCVCIDRHKEK